MCVCVCVCVCVYVCVCVCVCDCVCVVLVADGCLHHHQRPVRVGRQVWLDHHRQYPPHMHMPTCIYDVYDACIPVKVM